jgi:hypothetical protein
MILHNSLEISDPSEINNLNVATRNYLFEKLKLGLILFVVPEDFPEQQSKKHKNNYKIGFIYECLSIVYPDLNKTEKYEIISEKYHYFFTYRRFKDIYDEFSKSKTSYIQKRSLL